MPNSLNLVTLIRLGLLSQGHLSRFLVRSLSNPFCLPFHGRQASAGLAAVPGFNLFLTLTVLQRFIPVEHADEHARLSPTRQKTDYRCRRRIKAVQEYEPVSLSSLPCCGRT